MTKFLSWIGALAIVAAVAAGAYLFGGFYSVAADPDPDWLAWAIEKVRDASINRHATDAPPPAVTAGDQATIQAGARTFATRGCVYCHGVPGVDGSWAKFAETMQPTPPDLKEAVKDLTAGQIFWIVKNGINMTGMPAFGATMQDPEIWALAAFVRKSPGIPEADYRAWTADVAAPAPAPQPK